MGYSIRTDQYRYTRWQKYEDRDQVVERELYDHQKGPLATKNLAEDEAFATTVKNLDALMDQELGKYQLLKTDAVEKE